MRFNKIASVFFVFFFALTINAQTISNWKSFTNMENINDAFVDENGIWCATDGGAFHFTFSDSTYKSYNKANELDGSSITAITKDKYGKVWLGCLNGSIDIIDTKNNTHKRIVDIKNSGKASCGITGLFTSGDTVFVTSAFGLLLYSCTDFSCIETYLKFGSLNSNTQVNYMMPSYPMYVCLSGGLAKQITPKGNSITPDSWLVYNSANGLTGQNIKKIVTFNNQLLAITEYGIYYLDNDTWKLFLPDFYGLNIGDIVVNNDSLYILYGNNIARYKDNAYKIMNNKIAKSTFSKLVFSNNNLWILTDKGMYRFSETDTPKYVHPTGPPSNSISSLTIDKEGNLWAATGTNEYAHGFGKFDGIKWTQYTYDQDTLLGSDTFFKMYSAPDGNVYAGNWGSGFVKLTPENKITYFNSTNTALPGIPSNPKYIVNPGFGTDSKSNLWMINYNPSSRKFLSVLTKDSVWYHYTNTTDSLSAQNVDLAIDQYDTKWVINKDAKGLFYFNENGSFTNSQKISCGEVESSSISNNVPLCLVVDKRGDLWLGKTSGANIISNTYSVVGTTAPQFQVDNIYTLSQYYISAIAVDPINQKWVGTNQGLILTSSDGTSILQFLNSSNSPILDDEINCIAIEENTATVYIGTNKGISSFQTIFKKPVDAFTSLFVYPNPFIIDDKSKFATIDGLVQDSEIKILSVSGKLVNHFTTPGGRIAYWDGKNSDGAYVASGIYIVVAYDKDGNNLTTSKIAVIRKK